MIEVFYGTVDIVSCDDSYNEYYNRALPYRKEKIDRLKNENDKKRSLVAEILLDYALNCHGITSYEIISGELGKPYLSDNSLFFNISHSDKFIICAVSDREIGCDIEKITDRKIDLLIKKLSSYEINQIDNSPDKNKTFTEIWSMKESYLKAKGVGITESLSSFDVDTEKEYVSDDNYRIYKLDCFSGYAASVCVKSKEKEEIKIYKYKK